MRTPRLTYAMPAAFGRSSPSSRAVCTACRAWESPTASRTTGSTKSCCNPSKNRCAAVRPARPNSITPNTIQCTNRRTKRIKSTNRYSVCWPTRYSIWPIALNSTRRGTRRSARRSSTMAESFSARCIAPANFKSASFRRLRSVRRAAGCLPVPAAFSLPAPGVSRSGPAPCIWSDIRPPPFEICCGRHFTAADDPFTSLAGSTL